MDLIFYYNVLLRGARPGRGDTWLDLGRVLRTGALGRTGTQARPAGPWSPLQATPSPFPSHSQCFLFRLKFISFRRLDKFNNLYLEEKKLKSKSSHCLPNQVNVS